MGDAGGWIQDQINSLLQDEGKDQRRRVRTSTTRRKRQAQRESLDARVSARRAVKSDLAGSTSGRVNGPRRRGGSGPALGDSVLGGFDGPKLLG